jgi:putative spermidine/putrescine transport system permease protein
MPLILPGVISGGLFAFITSFDEVVVVLFVGSAGQKTLPWQMFTGLREQISPTILAVATILVAISIMLLTTVELLRRRSERLRGMYVYAMEFDGEKIRHMTKIWNDAHSLRQLGWA